VRALAAFLLLVSSAGCAAKAPPPQPPVAEAPPPPEGSKRLPSSIGCESGPPGEAAGRGVVEVVAAHAADMKSCYDALLATHPATQGRVMARFAISPAGAVETSCLVRSSMNDAAIDRCVVDRVLTWKFPARDAGGWLVVDHPFAFAR
jgi:protein TonB